MKIEYWPLEKIIPYEKNSKLHDDAAILASIRDFKPDQPIVVDADGVIIKGHGRLAAAKSLGLKDFPVIVRTDLTPAQVKAARIADNACNKPGWDQELLKLELAEIPEIDLTIYGLDVDLITGTEADSVLPKGSLADRFLIPPFSVFNAREGWWQDRKKTWLAIGIKSELGRGGNPEQAQDQSPAKNQHIDKLAGRERERERESHPSRIKAN